MRINQPELSSTSRRGTTLLEVLLATAILATSLAAIGQLATTGIDAGLRIQLESQAEQLCQSQLELFVAGMLPLRNHPQQAFLDNEDWVWSARVIPLNSEMVGLSVAVTHVKFHDTELVSTIHLIVSNDGKGFSS